MSPRAFSRRCSSCGSAVMCCWMCGLMPWWISGTRAACPTSRNAGRSTMRVSMGMLPSTVRRNLSCGCVRRGPPSRRTSPGPAPWTARNARPNASVEPYPCRTAMLSRSSSPRTTSAAATVMRRRRTYSDSGMPANDENIRRRWYSVVPSALANPLTSNSSVRCSSTRSTSRLSAEITRPPFDVNPGRRHPGRARPLRSDPIMCLDCRGGNAQLMPLAAVLVPGDQPPQIRKDLLVTIGEMGALETAVLGPNLHRWSDVDPYLEIAYRAAREAADPELEATVLGCRAYQAADGMHDKRLGLDFAEAAVTAARRGATTITRGWAATVVSERHADLGDERSSRQWLEQAQTILDAPEDGRSWSGIGTFDVATLTSYEGRNFGRLGRYRDAIRVLDSALSTVDPTMRRRRCQVLIDRAEAYQHDGNVDASCEDARAALAVAVGTQHGDIVHRAEAVARAALTTHASAARHLWQDVLAAKATTTKMGT